MRLVWGSPFAPGWEQKPGIDECAHMWEPIEVRPYPGAAALTVERCTRCGAPRCGSTRRRWKCVDRRHHRDLHIYEDGSFAPKSGLL